MVSALVEVESGVLGSHFLHVRNAGHQLERITALGVLFKHRNRVATLLKVFFDFFNHFVEGLAEVFLQLLESCELAREEVLAKTHLECHKCDCEPTLNYALVVPSAQGLQLGRRSQGVGDDQRD